jgi:hypothetical protein
MNGTEQGKKISRRSKFIGVRVFSNTAAEWLVGALSVKDHERSF